MICQEEEPLFITDVFDHLVHCAGFYLFILQTKLSVIRVLLIVTFLLASSRSFRSVLACTLTCVRHMSGAYQRDQRALTCCTRSLYNRAQDSESHCDVCVLARCARSEHTRHCRYSMQARKARRTRNRSSPCSCIPATAQQHRHCRLAPDICASDLRVLCSGDAVGDIALFTNTRRCTAGMLPILAD